MLPAVSAMTEPLVRALDVVYPHVSNTERSLCDEWGAAAEIADADGYRIHLFEPPS